MLGEERFLPKKEQDEAVEAFDRRWSGVNDKLERVGFELPEQALREVKEERVRRRNEKEGRECVGFPGL